MKRPLSSRENICSLGDVMVDGIKKPTGCVNIQQAKFQKLHDHFTSITMCVKGELFRLAMLLSFTGVVSNDK
jgi:hypothetical protein